MYLLQRPGGLTRWVYRLPIALYRWKLGWLLGRRFLLLLHRGRRSGQMRETVLEVVHHDEASDTYIVAAGFGARSDWFQNLRATPAAGVQVGRRTVKVLARQLSTEETYEELSEYGRRHPIATRLIARLLGLPLRGNEDQLRSAASSLPMVALEAVRPSNRKP